MKKVAVFGNTGAGKSTLSRQLSEVAGLPLHVLDKIQYPGGVEIPLEEYRQAHAQILATSQWVIDGFGCMKTTWQRLEAADCLVFLDLPLRVHCWWVTKRLISGIFRTPEGWPEGSPILKSSLTSYRTLWLCHKRLTPKYREYVGQARSTKQVRHLRSPKQIDRFLAAIAAKTNFPEEPPSSP